MTQETAVTTAARYFPPAPPPSVTKPVAKWVWLGSALLIAAIIACAIAIYRAADRSFLALVAPLHARMAAGDDAGIFSNSDPAYQVQVGATKSNQLFDYVRDRLGAPLFCHVSGFNYSGDAKEGVQLTLVFTTTFSKGNGTETIKWRKVNGQFRLLSYRVVSTKLVEGDIPQNLRS
jgi:hypothetical protein